MESDFFDIPVIFRFQIELPIHFLMEEREISKKSYKNSMVKRVLGIRRDLFDSFLTGCFREVELLLRQP
jgi:hypothetical protein